MNIGIKKSACVLLSSLLGFMGIAQNDKNDGMYEMVKEATEFNFVGIGLHILSLDVNMYNLPIMVGGEGFVSTNYVYGGYRFLIGEGLRETPGRSTEYLGSVYGSHQGVRTGSFYGGIPIYKMVETKDVKVRVAKGKDVSYYLEVPAKVKTAIGIDMAYDYGITPYIGPADKFVGVPYSTDPNQTEVRLSELEFSQGYTKFDYGVLSIGGGITQQHLTQIKTSKFGVKQSESFLRYYARLSFPVRAVLDDMLVPTPNNQQFRFELDGHTNISKMGFNVGFMTMGPNKFSGVWFAELGYFPGPAMGVVNNLYFKFGGGFSFAKIVGMVF
jgi:hypothetical protein